MLPPITQSRRAARMKSIFLRDYPMRRLWRRKERMEELKCLFCSRYNNNGKEVVRRPAADLYGQEQKHKKAAQEKPCATRQTVFRLNAI